MVKTLKPRVKPLQGRRLGTTDVRDTVRTTGRALQTRRFKMWSASPYCAKCGRLVAYPDGFELDHVVALYQGGADNEQNCEILCSWFETVDGVKVKRGCHAGKTAAERRENGAKI